MRPSNAARHIVLQLRLQDCHRDHSAAGFHLRIAFLRLRSRSKYGHTCRALSSALALGCSDVCDGRAGAGVTAAATSPLPGVSMACAASGEDGTTALAEPFSRATGTGGSDGGGTGMLPGAVAGSAHENIAEIMETIR